MIRKLDGIFFFLLDFLLVWFLFSHTNCIFISTYYYTFKTNDTNLSLLFLHVSLVLFSIQSKGIKRWGKKTRFRIVLNSNQEMSNYSFAFGFWSFGDLVPLVFSFFFFFLVLVWFLFNMLVTFGLKYDHSGPLLSCLMSVHVGQTSSPGKGCVWTVRSLSALLQSLQLQ